MLFELKHGIMPEDEDITKNVMAAPVSATFAYYIGLVINDKVGAIVELTCGQGYVQ